MLYGDSAMVCGGVLLGVGWLGLVVARTKWQALPKDASTGRVAVVAAAGIACVALVLAGAALLGAASLLSWLGRGDWHY